MSLKTSIIITKTAVSDPEESIAPQHSPFYLASSGDSGYRMRLEGNRAFSDVYELRSPLGSDVCDAFQRTAAPGVPG